MIGEWARSPAQSPDADPPFPACIAAAAAAVLAPRGDVGWLLADESALVGGCPLSAVWERSGHGVTASRRGQAGRHAGSAALVQPSAEASPVTARTGPAARVVLNCYFSPLYMIHDPAWPWRVFGLTWCLLAAMCKRSELVLVQAGCLAVWSLRGSAAACCCCCTWCCRGSVRVRPRGALLRSASSGASASLFALVVCKEWRDNMLCLRIAQEIT